MTKDKTILIKNIYYMLAYSFQALKQNNYKYISTESFNTIDKLFSEILYIGISQLIKRGLYKEYQLISDDTTQFKGKLNFNETIKNKIRDKIELNCEFDELNHNNKYNQIIKTTLFYLIKQGDIDSNIKDKLKQLYNYFNDVNLISNISSINWNGLMYQKNNKIYELIINVCYFNLHDLLQTTEDGKYKVIDFTDSLMHKVYERFIFEYYKKEFPSLEVSSSKIEWDYNEREGNMSKYMPEMQSDVMINNKDNNKTLIIDAKYYSKVLSNKFDKKTFHSFNLYQIFTYVKNYEVVNNNVSGMLLYAKTDEELSFDGKMNISGHDFAVKVLDLNEEFDLIKEQLNKIINEYIYN